MVEGKAMLPLLAGTVIGSLLAGCGAPKMKSSGILSDYKRLRRAMEE